MKKSTYLNISQVFALVCKGVERSVVDPRTLWEEGREGELWALQPSASSVGAGLAHAPAKYRIKR